MDNRFTINQFAIKFGICCILLSVSSCKMSTIQENLPFNLGNNKETVGTGAGGILGAVFGEKFCKGKSKSLCVAASTALGAYAGNRIGKHLDEQDKLKMAEATKSAITTGKTKSWSTLENRTSGSVKVVGTKMEDKPIKIKVLKKRVKQVPPLDIIGTTYETITKLRVRGGPSKEYEEIGQLKQGQVVDVVGKVKTNDWYMISTNGVGSGFASGKYLKEAPDKVAFGTEESFSESDIAEEQIAPNRLCRTVEQSVTLEDGSKMSETVEACQGSNGWEIKA